MKCEYCNSYLGSIKNKNAHLRYCKDYKTFIRNIELILTKEYFINHYINNGESLKFIAKELGLKNVRLVSKMLTKHGIKKRTLQEAKKQNHHIELAKITSKERYGYEFHVVAPSIISKKEATNIKRYGVDNPFKSIAIRDKAKQTCFKNYGVTNPFASSIIKKQIRKTNFKNYGHYNVFGNKEINKKAIKTKIKNGTLIPFVSKISQEFSWLLYNQLNKEDKRYCYFHELNKEFGKWSDSNYYLYDFVLTNKLKCIEFNGNYYHMNPKLYEANEFNKKMGLTAKEIWKKDSCKLDVIKDCNYDILVIWENDYIKNKQKVIRECLNFLKN